MKRREELNKNSWIESADFEKFQLQKLYMSLLVFCRALCIHDTRWSLQHPRRMITLCLLSCFDGSPLQDQTIAKDNCSWNFSHRMFTSCSIIRSRKYEFEIKLQQWGPNVLPGTWCVRTTHTQAQTGILAVENVQGFLGTRFCVMSMKKFSGKHDNSLLEAVREINPKVESWGVKSLEHFLFLLCPVVMFRLFLLYSHQLQARVDFLLFHCVVPVSSFGTVNLVLVNLSTVRFSMLWVVKVCPYKCAFLPRSKIFLPTTGIFEFPFGV